MTVAIPYRQRVAADSAYYDHTIGRRMGRAAQRVCPECLAGKHRGAGTFGCLNVVAPPPQDYVCECGDCRPSAPRPTATCSTCDGSRVVEGFDHHPLLCDDGEECKTHCPTKVTEPCPECGIYAAGEVEIDESKVPF